MFPIFQYNYRQKRKYKSLTHQEASFSFLQWKKDNKRMKAVSQAVNVHLICCKIIQSHF